MSVVQALRMTCRLSSFAEPPESLLSERETIRLERLVQMEILKTFDFLWSASGRSTFTKETSNEYYEMIGC